MGVRLIVEVLDFAPANLTPRERWTLIVLAEGARDTTRVCWPGIEDDDVFIRRSRLSRSQRYAVLKALIDKGALENVRRGQKGVRAGYRIAELAPSGAVLPESQDSPEEGEERNSQGPGSGDAEPTSADSQGPGSQDAEKSRPEPQRPGSQDAEKQDADAQGPGFGDSGSRFSDFSVPDYRTPSPQSPQSPHQLQEDADASGAATHTEPTQEAFFTDEISAKRETEKAFNRRVKRLTDHYCRLIKTADFHKTRGGVKKALELEVGTDEQIETALTAIAEVGRFAPTADSIRIEINRATPRPDLRAVSGGYQPYRNPTDTSVYDEEF